LPKSAGSSHSHPHGLEISRLFTAHREIWRLRNRVFLDDTPPHAGQGRSNLTEEDFRFQAGGIGGGEQSASGLEHGRG
jgi:hypothetical protein